MLQKILFCLFFSAYYSTIPSITSIVTQESLTPTTQKLTIQCTGQEQELLFADSVSFSLDTPDAIVTDWKATPAAVQKYTNLFKDTRSVYILPTTIQVIIEEKKPATRAYTLHMQYMTSVTQKPTEQLFTIPFVAHNAEPEATEKPITSTKNAPEISIKSILVQKIKDAIHAIFTYIHTWSTSITDHIKGTHSRTVQIFLIFLLGVLMSLTPCIYPMIPVTIGILQANSAHSFMRNFLIALSYTLGVATTFAFLGLLAATGGAQFGSLAGNPIFIIGIVLILGYLGLSMFGWYEMYIPRFLQPKNSTIKNGSPLSAFIFGAISGTIASPCLSPGLAFILSIVASLKSTALGLLLLFAFGIGSSLPLLIIGTFSSSLNVLPKAGTWMIEVKKLFGFMLFGMCFYYLQVIIPTPVLLGIISSFLALKGVWYIMQVRVHDSKRIKNFKNSMGFILIASSVVVLFYACRDWTCAPVHQATSVWRTDFAQAQTEAKAAHKNLLLDITADWCSVCKMLEKQVLNAPEVVHAFDTIIPVTINSTNPHSEPYATLKTQYAIVGVPTVLLIDGQTGELIKRWGSELLEMDIQEFVRELQV